MVAMMNQDAPYSGIAGLMASKGRYGDTELLHVRPDELTGLASMGQLTINPDTGLPEAFSFKSLLPAIGAIAGSILLPGAGTFLGSGLAAGAVGAGLGSFAGGLAAGQSPTQALIGGLMSGATSGVLGGLTGGADSILSTIPEASATAANPIAQAASSGAVDAINTGVQGGLMGGLNAPELAALGYSPTDIAQFAVVSQGSPGAITPEILTAARSVTPANTANLTIPDASKTMDAIRSVNPQLPPMPSVRPPSGLRAIDTAISPVGTDPTARGIALAAPDAGSNIPTNPIQTPAGTTIPGARTVNLSEPVAKNLSKGFLSPDIAAGPQDISDVIKAGGSEAAGVLADKGYDVGISDIAAGKLSRPSTYFGLGKAALGEIMNPTLDEEEMEDSGLSSFIESSYTPRNLRLTGGEFTQGDLTQDDYTRLALEGGLGPALTPFRYEEQDTVTLSEGGSPEAEDVDTQVEEDTVASEEKRKEEEILQKRKAASEVDKFISNAVGSAALGAMVQGGLNQDPAATATPYGQGAQPINVGANFGFNQGGLVGLSNGGSASKGSKKNSFNQKQELVYNFFSKKGYPDESIAAIMGNIAVEAPTFDSTQKERGKKKGKAQGKGLFQFTGARQSDYNRYLQDNKLKDSASNQMEYVHEQMTSTVKQPYDAGGKNKERLRKVLLGEGMGSVEDRAKVISDIFLRPGVPHMERRMEESLNMFDMMRPTDQSSGLSPYFEGKVTGPGDGQSDQVLFDVEGDDPDMALLSPEEYVIPADAVAMIGSGSSTAGAKKLDSFVKNIRKKATGSTKQQKPIKQGLESFLS